jgi:hypothetical protein
MPLYAANGVPVTTAWNDASKYPSQGWFKWPIKKVDVFANGTDVVFQVLEDETGWTDDQTQEMIAPMGFSSVELVTPAVAVRFRVWPGTQLAPSGTVHIKLLG